MTTSPTPGRIIRLVEQLGGAWMSEIMTMLNLSPGATGGHLNALVRRRRLIRPERGWYILPGMPAKPTRPRPGDPSKAATRANLTRWARATDEDRREAADRLTEGRQAAARRRRAERARLELADAVAGVTRLADGPRCAYSGPPLRAGAPGGPPRPAVEATGGIPCARGESNSHALADIRV